MSATIPEAITASQYSNLLVCDPETCATLIQQRQSSRLDRYDEVWDGVYIMSPNANDELAYFASTRLRCSLERVVWSNQSGIFCELAGYEVAVQVLKHRRGAPGAVARLRIVAARDGAPLRAVGSFQQLLTRGSSCTSFA